MMTYSVGDSLLTVGTLLFFISTLIGAVGQIIVGSVLFMKGML
jgi:hypothetical protein